MTDLSNLPPGVSPLDPHVSPPEPPESWKVGTCKNCGADFRARVPNTGEAFDHYDLIAECSKKCRPEQWYPTMNDWPPAFMIEGFTGWEPKLL